MTPLLLAILIAISQTDDWQSPAVDWISICVEREAFLADSMSRQYFQTGQFDGVGLVYLSVNKRTITFSGIRRIRLFHPGQDSSNIYEIHCESFAITSIDRAGDASYRFEGIAQNEFRRSVQGSFRYSVKESGLVGVVDDFQMTERGRDYQGVMNRFSIARSTVAQEILSRYSEIYLGGNYVALDFAE